MSPLRIVVIAAAVLAAGCAALPRGEVEPSERGEIKTGTNIHRERDAPGGVRAGPGTNPIQPSAAPVGAGGARGG